ncbi:uncharacterized protein LOC142231314 [Haematobia irritans]|uniref:uncharacterized protein LOC142231314 n=1 Tax=Haematobia irritans TaxID=7368 RepID=UPI003F507107
MLHKFHFLPLSLSFSSPLVHLCACVFQKQKPSNNSLPQVSYLNGVEENRALKVLTKIIFVLNLKEERAPNTIYLRFTKEGGIFENMEVPVFRRKRKRLPKRINSCISLLELYEIDVGGWDPIFVFVCSNCLPNSTLTLWEQTLPDKTVIPKWEKMDNFLTDRHRTLESVSEVRKSIAGSSTASKATTKTDYRYGNKSNGTHVHTFQNKVEPNCPLCPKETHLLRKCPRFLKMSPSEREESKLSDSPSGSNSTPSQVPSSSIQSTNISGEGVVHTCFSTSSRDVLLGTALVNISYNGLMICARALVDSGSQGTFISEKLFNSMRLPFRKTYATVSGLNNSVSASVQKECSFTLSPAVDNGIEFSATALVVPHLSGSLPSRTIDLSSLSDIPNIPLADPRFYQSSKIDLLLGGDLLPSIMLPGVQRQICGSLIAQETIFGWILTGPLPAKPVCFFSSVVTCFNEISLEKEISRFWEVEELPRKKFMSPSDQFCEDLFLRTTKRSDSGRYVVSLPFKDNFPEGIGIGLSRKNAMAQFFRSEARLLRTPQFKLEYDEVLNGYVQLGHMRKIDPPNTINPENAYYLPHHAVIKPESTTTRVRVVFNASSPTSNGISLNDVLHIGPVLQNDLMILILRWRFFRFVFNGDITKMYRQIRVNPQHTPFQRILYRENPDSPVQDFELETVTFGVNCAPYLAIRTLLQLADDVQSTFPLASDILRNSMYVDDALVGAHTLYEAKQAMGQLVNALGSAGFTMRKWTANSRELIANIPCEDLLCDDFLQFHDRSSAKTLGIRWNAMSDSFYFSMSPFSSSQTFSKREILSQISKLFDPAGWLSPCVVVAKIIMQQIWMEKTEWDDTVSDEILTKWKSFQAHYPSINSIKIPRWFPYSPNCKVQFHGFCDASEKAYAAVLYVRVEADDYVSTSLVSSKTRVAPIKTLSIPRLELCGATLLAEMVDNLLSRFSLGNYSIRCWTDSTIVLAWLAKPPCFWATFVANRISKIIEIVNPSEWAHVDSGSNPADLASRGVYPNEIIGNTLWWNGPSWLRKSPDDWPKSNNSTLEAIEIERKSISVHFNYFDEFDDVLNRFSSLPRALRVVAYMYRFYFRTHSNFRVSFHRTSAAVSSSEILMVQNRLISMSQKAFFPNEYMALSAKAPLSKSSPILNLNPFCDSEGILRVCGRLVSSTTLSYNEKHPIILPYKCRLSMLLVQFIHDISLHGGNQLVLRLVRTQFWIPRAKNLIKSVINKCKPCIIYKKRCQVQLMSALPPERVDISRPFVHTGLDFAGPFDIKNYTGRACLITKGYVCVFVCFSTKAIHLEATSDLSTPAFLAAFSRFISRQGCPLHIHSDNGTTFNISWHFIPPGAPHMGGLWEAGVKSFKAHFKKIAVNLKYTFEEFQTLLARIESCLNSRPLYPMSEDPSDLNALTPGHFLIGSPILAPIDPSIREAPMSLVNRWQRLKAIHQHFCIRWKDEYLKELHKRHKWQRPTENLKENMLVVIREENIPPNCWRLGRIVKVYPGRDSRVRVADVTTAKGLITRPITKLVILPIDST